MEVPYCVCVWLTTDPPIIGDKYTPEALKAQNQSILQSYPLPDDKDKEDVIFFWASRCMLGYATQSFTRAARVSTFLVPWRKKILHFKVLFLIIANSVFLLFNGVIG